MSETEVYHGTAAVIKALKEFGGELGVPALVVLFVFGFLYIIVRSIKGALLWIVDFVGRKPSVLADGTVDAGGWGYRIGSHIIGYISSAQAAVESQTTLLTAQAATDEKLQVSVSAMQMQVIALQKVMDEILRAMLICERDAVVRHAVMKQAILHLARVTEVMAESEGWNIAAPLEELRRQLRCDETGQVANGHTDQPGSN